MMSTTMTILVLASSETAIQHYFYSLFSADKSPIRSMLSTYLLSRSYYLLQAAGQFTLCITSNNHMVLLILFYFIGNKGHRVFFRNPSRLATIMLANSSLFLFYVLYFKMAWITIMAFKTNMNSSFITIYTLTIWWINIGRDILMHTFSCPIQ